MTGTLIKYPEERAIEDAAFGQGLIPTRLCRLLLPVWRVDVRATIYDSEPYDLIDRYLEAAIAKGGLGTVQEIADFYGLDEAVTGSAARFLESIGHLSRDGGLVLSDLGVQSVRENRRYIRALEDRRHLYFDGFLCRPLTRAFYDDREVTFLDGPGLAAALADTGWGAFTCVDRIPTVGFGPESLAALAQLPVSERDRFNLPEQVVSPTLAGQPEQVYLPAYVIRVIDSGSPRFLAYTQASQECDPEWSRVCTSAVEVATLVGNEYDSGRDEGEEATVRRWVERRFTGRFDVGWRDGVLVATLPAAAFTGTDGLKPRRIGSFVKMKGWYFRICCDDEQLRQQALLDLAADTIGQRTKITADEADKRLTKFCRQVDLRLMSAPEAAHLARDAGRTALADRLDKLAD